MDWLLLLGLVALLIVAAATSFFLYAFVVRTRKEFRATQPDLRITNLSAMNSGNILTLYPELDNVGLGVAVKKVYPRGPRYEKHVASIVLGPDAPIRGKPMNIGYLRLSYRDRWGQKYECWYPVAQVRSGVIPPYNPQIDLEHPDLTEPHPSFWEMRKFLRSTSPYD